MSPEKKQRLSNLLANVSADAAVFFDVPSIRFMCGIDISDNVCAATPRGLFLTADPRYFESASKLEGVTAVPTPDGVLAALADIFASNGVKTVAVDERKTTVSEWRALERLVTPVAASGELDRFRACKDKAEMSLIRKAQSVTDAAYEYILGELHEGVTEAETAAKLDYFMARSGCGRAFETIVLFGAKSSVPHGVPGGTELKNNMPVLFDFGAMYEGFCSDMSRTVFFGSRPPEEFRTVWDAVFRAQKEALGKVRAGLTGRECDAFARDYLASCGYGEGFTHSLGHGIGCEIHEWPNFAPRADYVLPAHSVLSVEPGVYLPGRFGIRIEDMVYLTDDGAENLTGAKKEMCPFR